MLELWTVQHMPGACDEISQCSQQSAARMECWCSIAVVAMHLVELWWLYQRCQVIVKICHDIILHRYFHGDGPHFNKISIFSVVSKLFLLHLSPFSLFWFYTTLPGLYTLALIYCHAHKSPSMNCFLSQLNLVHIITPYYLKIRSQCFPLALA